MTFIIEATTRLVFPLDVRVIVRNMFGWCQDFLVAHVDFIYEPIIVWDRL